MIDLLLPFFVGVNLIALYSNMVAYMKAGMATKQIFFVITLQPHCNRRAGQQKMQQHGLHVMEASTKWPGKIAFT